MDLFSSLSSFERRLLGGSVVIAILALLAMSFDGFFSGKDSSSKRKIIGEISTMSNDTRLKGASSLLWFKAQQKQEVRLGDSLFTGDNSAAQVALKKGGAVDVGENSLIVFNEVNGEPLANINFGNFRINADGTVKLAINGRITTIQGKNSDLQVFIDKNKKPQVRLLRGEAKIQQKSQPAVELNASRSIASIELAEKRDIEEEEPTAPEDSLAANNVPDIGPSPKARPPRLMPDMTVKTVPYTWRLYDLYNDDNGLLRDRIPQPDRVSRTVNLKWSVENESVPLTISLDHSQFADFKVSSLAQHKGKEGALTEVFIGDNFWRISYDGQVWSEVQSFRVEPGLLPLGKLQVTRQHTSIPLVTDTAFTRISLKGEFPAMGYVVEASSSSRFEKGSTQAFWTPDPTFQVSFRRTGSYYYRFRAANKSQELTTWSDVEHFTVFAPRGMPSFRLADQQLEGYVGETLSFKWKAPELAKNFSVEFYDQNQQLLETLQTADPQAKWTTQVPGSYKARVYAYDSWGRKVEGQGSVQMLFKEKPIIAKKEEPQRKPAESENKSVAKTEKREPLELFRAYRNNVQFEGFVAEYLSKPQLDDNVSGPMNGGVGIRAKHWWGSNGVEGRFSSGLANMNSTGSQGNAKQFELRYHRRIFFDKAMGLLPSIQWSFFGGYHLYRNATSAYFSPAYDLMKVGSAVTLPLLSNWDFAGELALGLGTDSSKQYELSGQFDYFFHKDWSVGLGYRLRFFEAGSTRSAPNGLPFREGSAETFSALKVYY